MRSWPTRRLGKVLSFRYRFRFDDGRSEELCVELEYETLSLIAAELDSYPSWTELGFHKCRTCPLHEATHPHCPIARNLIPVVDLLKDRISYEQVDVEVETNLNAMHEIVSLSIEAEELTRWEDMFVERWGGG